MNNINVDPKNTYKSYTPQQKFQYVSVLKYQVKDGKLFRVKTVNKQPKLVHIAFLENVFEFIYNVHAMKIHPGMF